MASTPQIKQTWSTSIKNDAGASVVADPPVVIIGDSETNLTFQVPAGTTVEIDGLDVLYAKIVSMYIWSDVAVTANTNAADATGGDSFAMPGKKAVAWNNTMTSTCPITHNVTKVYAINAGTTVANFRAGFLLVNAA